MEYTPSIWLCEHVVHAMEEKSGFQQRAKDSKEKVTHDGQLGPRPHKAVTKEPHPLWSTLCGACLSVLPPVTALQARLKLEWLHFKGSTVTLCQWLLH